MIFRCLFIKRTLILIASVASLVSLVSVASIFSLAENKPNVKRPLLSQIIFYQNESTTNQPYEIQIKDVLYVWKFALKFALEFSDQMVERWLKDS